MDLIKKALLLVLCAAPAWAIDVSACGNLATQGATYNLTTDLVQSGSTRCLIVTATNPANVIIDCNGHSITFDGEGAIALNGRDNIEIRNCVFNSAATGYSASAFTWNAIDGKNSGSDNISIHDNTFNLDHDAAPEIYGFILSNVASDNVEYYDNVCNLDGAYRSTCFEITGAGAKTNYYIHHNTITVEGTAGARPTGIGLIGSTSAEVSYNTITVNSPGTLGDTDEFQAISCFNCVTPNLHHNTITDYSTHSRAFSVDNVNGGSIHHNTLYLVGEGRLGNINGIGMRGNTDGVEVYQNVIDARGCTSGAGGGCALIYIGNDTNPGDGTFPTNNLLHDNWLYVSGATNTMVPLELTDELEAGNRFWNMTISCEDDTFCLKIDPLNQTQLDVEFAYFDFQDASTLDAAYFQFSSNISEFSFCESEVNGSPFASGDITDSGGTLPVGEPSITSSPCLCETAALGCGPTVGARADGISIDITGSISITGAVSF